MRTEMILITARTGVLHSGRNNGALAIILRTATRVCDLNVASAVGSRRRVSLPVGAESDDFGAYWAYRYQHPLCRDYETSGPVCSDQRGFITV